MKRLILLLAVCLLFSGCLKVLPAAQKSDVTLESIVEANYISTLTAGGQFVIVSSAASGGDSSTTSFFLHGGEIARCEEGSFQGEAFCSGVWNGISFTVSDDVTLAVTNTLNAAIPTGVWMSFGTLLLLGGLCLIGIFCITSRKRRTETFLERMRERRN